MLPLVRTFDSEREASEPMEEVAKGQHLPPAWEAGPAFFMHVAERWDMHAR